MGKAKETTQASARKNKNEVVKDALQTVFEDPDVINKLVEALMPAFETLMTEVREEFKNEISALKCEYTKRIDFLEQENKQNSLLIHGIKDEGEMNETQVLAIVKEKLNESMKIKIENHQIGKCYRIGRLNKNHNGEGISDKNTFKNSRPILLKLNSNILKEEIYKSRFKLKNTGIILREDLTYFRRKLVRIAIDEHGRANVWTQNGQIYYKAPDGKKVKFRMDPKDLLN